MNNGCHQAVLVVDRPNDVLKIFADGAHVAMTAAPGAAFATFGPIQAY